MRRKAAFIGALFCVALMGMSVQADDYTVTTTMNFRSSPSILGQSIGSVPSGAVVTYLNSSDGWDYVSYGGSYGWIHGGNITAGVVPVAANTTQASQTSQTAASSYSSGQSQSVTVLYGMNFRAAPGMDGQIMNTVPAGTTVQYLGTSNGWDRIMYNGVQGWIASGRVTSAGTQTAAASSYAAAAASTSANTYTSTSGGSAARVGDTMNFRSGPGLTNAVMGLIPTGSAVQVISSSNGWDKVIYNGTTGWIKSGNVQ